MAGKRPFHFHTLGFRRNPFGALSDEEWATVAILPPAIQAQLDKASAHVQLLGPKGCGKTTTMRRIRADLEAQHLRVAYEYLPEGTTRFATPLTGLDAFLPDEAQRLNRWERRRWLKGVQNGRLRTIFSSHGDLSRLFARRRLPLTTIRIDAQISLAHYQAVLQRRLAYFALNVPPRITFAPEAVAFLYETFGADMREAEYFLYEVWQALEKVGAITAVFLQRQYRMYG